MQVQFRAFVKPDESLERSLDSQRERARDAPGRKRPNYRNVDSPTDDMLGPDGAVEDDDEEEERQEEEEGVIEEEGSSNATVEAGAIQTGRYNGFFFSILKLYLSVQVRFCSKRLTHLLTQAASCIHVLTS